MMDICRDIGSHIEARAGFISESLGGDGIQVECYQTLDTSNVPKRLNVRAGLDAASNESRGRCVSNG
jgi:hypothetical protein